MRSAAHPTTAPILELSGVTKRYGDFTAVDVPALVVNDGELFTIVGPSGSGKSTLLGILSGSIAATSGDIRIRGQVVNDLPPERRPTATVFQSLALFPHLSVGENIEFPMSIRKTPPQERRRRALELMTQLRLPESYAGKSVTQCSGGERQRVAIARSLAYEPDILLFDESLSAVDYRLRKTLQVELTEIHRTTGKTFIFVTHSIEEALVMSDRIAIMQGGKVVQIGTPSSIYLEPANRFVADFLGDTNIFDASVTGISDGKALFSVEGLDKPVKTNVAAQQGERLYLALRPERLRVLGPGQEADNSYDVVIEHAYLLGSRIQYRGRLGSHSIVFEQLLDESTSIAPGSKVRVGWDRSDGVVVSK